MQSLINLPLTPAFVRNSHICQSSRPDGVSPCYLVAVEVVLNEAPKLMILLENGAAFCYVPIHAICFDRGSPAIELADVCRWDCLADAGECVTLEFLKDWRVEWRGKVGRYLFTIHFNPRGGWSRLPEQAKLFHFLALDDGNLAIGVNNEMRWVCDAFDQDAVTIRPEANRMVWWAES